MSDDTTYNIVLQKQGVTSAEKPDKPTIWKPALKEAGWAFLGATVLLIVTYTVFFRSFHPEFTPFIDRDARRLIVPGKDLIPVSVGAASKTSNQFIIEDFNEDEAVLVLPRAFQAEDYPFIKVNLSGFTRYSKLKIIWRRLDDMAQTHALEFNRSGDEVTQIPMVYGADDYRGKIADIALLFYDGPALGFDNNDDVDIVIDSIEFLPFSAARVAEQIFEDWTNPPLWQGYSNNVVKGIHPNGMIFPNMAANLLVVTGLMLVIALRRLKIIRQPSTTPFLATTLCLFAFGWGFTDALRWHWRAEQLLDTHLRYANKSFDKAIRSSSRRCALDQSHCKSDLLPYF